MMLKPKARQPADARLLAEALHEWRVRVDRRYILPRNPRYPYLALQSDHAWVLYGYGCALSPYGYSLLFATPTGTTCPL